jgi:hypothetical protein
MHKFCKNERENFASESRTRVIDLTRLMKFVFSRRRFLRFSARRIANHSWIVDGIRPTGKSKPDRSYAKQAEERQAVGVGFS